MRTMRGKHKGKKNLNLCRIAVSTGLSFLLQKKVGAERGQQALSLLRI